MEAFNATYDPANPSERDERLRLLILQAISDPGNVPSAGNAKGDRTVSTWSRDAVWDLLVEEGQIIPSGPKATDAHHAAQTFALELIFTGLVVRLMRTLVLGNVILPETPAAMDWLKSYIDGNGHGPTGQAMRWPEGLLGVAALLRNWGFEPTETDPPFVRRARPKTGTVQ